MKLITTLALASFVSGCSLVAPRPIWTVPATPHHRGASVPSAQNNSGPLSNAVPASPSTSAEGLMADHTCLAPTNWPGSDLFANARPIEPGDHTRCITGEMKETFTLSAGASSGGTLFEVEVTKISERGQYTIFLHDSDRVEHVSSLYSTAELGQSSKAWILVAPNSNATLSLHSENGFDFAYRMRLSATDLDEQNEPNNSYENAGVANVGKAISGRIASMAGTK